jgi:GntP family gluconate:H+ symporter
MGEATRMILGLVIGILVMIILVMKTKVHTFIALLIAAMITGLIGGMPITRYYRSDGTETTRSDQRHHAGLRQYAEEHRYHHRSRVMMGGILEKSGAAERLAFTFIKKLAESMSTGLSP